MPSGKGEAAAHHELAALAAAQPEEIRTRRTAAEATLGAVRARLGAPGTYDTPGSTTTPSLGVGSAGTAGASEGAFVTEKAKSAQATGLDYRYSTKDRIQDITRLDPAKYTENLEKSAEFRIASRLTAESEQLLARKGPLWDELVNFQQAPVIEGFAALNRENAETIRKAIQKGGAGAARAKEAVMKMRQTEQYTRDKTAALMNHRVALDQWARGNARDQLKFNQDWASNLSGIREEYNNAMDKASDLMLSKALPYMAARTESAAQWRYRAHAAKRQKVTRWIDGVVGVASMFLGAGGSIGGFGLGAPSAEIFGAGTALLGKSTSPLGIE